MFGRGESWGALTVVNALATGMGAALGVKLKTTVEVSTERKSGWVELRASRSAGDLLGSVYEEFSHRAGVKPFTLTASVATELPSGVGMKSSSSVANALILALADAYNIKIDHADVLSINAVASIKAGVSRTGALDDAAACLLGGVNVTDNRVGRILAKYSANQEKAVFLVPRSTARPSLELRFREPFRCSVRNAHRLALAGRYHEAINLNGTVYANLYGYDTQPIIDAWRAGATAAGVTGNGPAFAALVESEDTMLELVEKWTGYGKIVATETRNPGDD